MTRRHALPAPSSMPREERCSLRSERAASAPRRMKLAVHRRLRNQIDRCRMNGGSLDDCHDLRALIAAARQAQGPRFEFGGVEFRVRRGLAFSTVSTRNGRHLASFAGEIWT